MCLGGNSLGSPGTTPEQLARDLISRYSVVTAERLVFCSVLPRKEGRYRVPTDFDQLRSRFNAELRKVCESSPRTTYWRLNRRLNNEALADDGVHLTRDRERTFILSLRLALLRALTDLRSGARV